MTLYDLLFLAALFASVLTLLTAALLPIFRRGAQALRILSVWSVCAAVYLGIGMFASMLRPLLVLNLGDEQCSDDWCIAVQSARRAETKFVVNLKFSSRAKRVEQSEKGAIVYLTDTSGRRYDPIETTVPLSTRLAPGESVSTSVVFSIPPEVRQVALVVGHKDWTPPGWLILGREPFEKTVVKLDVTQ